MKKLYLFLIALLLSFAGIYYTLTKNFQRDLSTFFYNGTILTMDSSRPQVEAIYIRRGKIEVLGSYEECVELINPG
jgi:hypothetical protein